MSEPVVSQSQQFANLSATAARCMGQLLHTETTASLPPLTWTEFCKMMTEMGFSADHSTLGSSTRFDPPDASARSISFHKPHPETHIQPVTLRIWGKKLKESYGWETETFEQARRAE